VSDAVGASKAREPSAAYLVQREPALFRSFELLATARTGLRALRELISSLALQGRLVGQVSTDEPATSLIRRVATSNGRGFPAFVNADLPTGWVRVSFGDYASRINTGPFGSLIGKGDYVRGGVPLVNPSHMRGGRIAAEADVAVSRQKAIELAAYALLNGDIVFARRGEVGRTALVTDNENGWLCGTGSFFARFEREVDRAFVQLVFGSLVMRRYLAGAAVGVTMVNLNQRMLRSAVLDVPPLAEQRRIVARVEELMKLCDALEQSGRLADEQHARLTSTLFDALAASESAHTLAENWGRIAEHFDLLLDRPEAIDALEQTMLDLAVRGRLVRQDANDEPATELLERVRIERERLIVEGTLTRVKSASASAEEDAPYQLPAGWKWVRLGQLLSKIGAGSTPLGGKDVYTATGVKFLRSQNIWNDGLRLSGVALIPRATHSAMSGTVVRPNDLLFNITGASIGRCAVVPVDFEEANVSQHVTIVRPAIAETKRFLHLVLISKHVQQTVRDVQVGVSREGLSMAKLSQFAIPLPPLAEQHRIVAGVEELRRLCAQLRERLTEARRVQSQLADALVQQVTNAPGPNVP
jgi:type I restriction enzyme, S subunit